MTSLYTTVKIWRLDSQTVNMFFGLCEFWFTMFHQICSQPKLLACSWTIFRWPSDTPWRWLGPADPGSALKPCWSQYKQLSVGVSPNICKRSIYQQLSFANCICCVEFVFEIKPEELRRLRLHLTWELSLSSFEIGVQGPNVPRPFPYPAYPDTISNPGVKLGGLSSWI